MSLLEAIGGVANFLSQPFIPNGDENQSSRNRQRRRRRSAEGRPNQRPARQRSSSGPDQYSGYDRSNVFGSSFFQGTAPHMRQSTAPEAESGQARRTQQQQATPPQKQKPSQKAKPYNQRYAGADFASWNVKRLKSYLQSENVDFAHCVEKSELVKLCRETTWPLPTSTDDESAQCTICFDCRIDTVLISCGHQFCSICTYDMEECPMCMSKIESRLRTYR
mmetsp:Transcript_528/g.908  ORF Transcript_528/g.908 Transcript_528/m.908 type:complete len:221 (+) Transcript_528:487-1149(+)